MVASLFCLAFSAAPIKGLDIFAPEVTAQFPFTLGYTITEPTGKTIVSNSTVIYPNGTQVITSVTSTEFVKTYGVYAKGLVTLTGKGGLSADNPLTMRVILYSLSFRIRPQQIAFVPQGAFEAANSWNPLAPVSPKLDALGLPVSARIPLTENSGVWSGDQIVIYNQGGALMTNLNVDGQIFAIIEPILIESEAVTALARTNSLLVSLTWVIIAFPTIEARETLQPLIERVVEWCIQKTKPLTQPLSS